MLTHMMVYRSAAGRSQPNVDVFAQIVCKLQARWRRLSTRRDRSDA